MPAPALLFCLLLIASAPSLAVTIYKTTDAQGVVTYSDKPGPGAKAFSFRPAVPGGSAKQPHAFRYRYPWRGGPFRLSQGPLGGYSHFTREGRYAMDIAMPEGTPIIAARGGVVIKTENLQAGRGTHPSGNFVRILHPDGTMGVYLHLLQGSVAVGEGQRVAQGELLARSGNTGRSSGPHLHFVVQRAVGLAMESIPYQFERPLAPLPDFTAGNP
ncbi:hypothetical protein PS627_03408 [Pseudomonas fluorescens]|uniref:M23 family metallopeptidase n=1 Tax=Pseudomonas fluorescens TaxID=294 RepID=UPI001253AB73|nr:M23 family metallopeptidase [Pseudomonas fluorescens]CAG8869291.1 hypothetical protein PS627_03408 [Pseudomonas fluorescens]VVP72063.1 hypothetical protein PS910_00987 [Pseudomonas fluorescens]